MSVHLPEAFKCRIWTIVRHRMICCFHDEFTASRAHCASATAAPFGQQNVVSQIKRYDRGLADTGRVLLQPDLTSYSDLLLESLAPAKVRVKLSGIRRSYKALVGNPPRRAALVARLQAGTRAPRSSGRTRDMSMSSQRRITTG